MYIRMCVYLRIFLTLLKLCRTSWRWTRPTMGVCPLTGRCCCSHTRIWLWWRWQLWVNSSINQARSTAKVGNNEALLKFGNFPTISRKSGLEPCTAITIRIAFLIVKSINSDGPPRLNSCNHDGRVITSSCHGSIAAAEFGQNSLFILF